MDCADGCWSRSTTTTFAAWAPTSGTGCAPRLQGKVKPRLKHSWTVAESVGDGATTQSASNTLRSLQGLPAGSTNASRDVHRNLRKLGYSLSVPIQSIDHACEQADIPSITTYHVKPEDWIKHWMNEHPELLGAGQNFKAFWENYAIQHPSHELYQHHQERLDRLVPILLHGDEGRSLKRSNYLVMSMESPLGSLNDPNLRCECEEHLKKRPGIPTYGSDLGAVDEHFLAVCRRQTTNYKGHSYLSRWLLFGLGGWVYKRHPGVVDVLLAEIVASLRKLFFDGVETKAGTMFAALVGVKGDLDFHKKIMELQRSYANIGTKQLKELCHLCLAGGPGVAFEDYTEQPCWLETMTILRPWSTENPPVLTKVPYDDLAPEQMLKLDVFHVFKLGIARDIIGGIVVLLLRLKFFDFPGSSVNLDDRFKRAYGNFSLWCLANSKSPGLRSFSKAFFNMKNLMSAPWVSSKGSDSMLLLEWLRHVLTLELHNPTVSGHDQLLDHMLQVVEASLSLRMLSYHKLWLERKCAAVLYINIMTILRGYAVLGRSSLNLRVRGFVQKPKAHSLHHLAVFLKIELEKGASLIASPQCGSCELNEDFLGRISRLSRRVGIRLCDLRVFERYFIKVTCLLKKRVDRRTGKVRKEWAKRWKPT